MIVSGKLMLGVVVAVLFSASILAARKGTDYFRSQEFEEGLANKLPPALNHTLVNHIRNNPNRGKPGSQMGRELSEHHNHSIYNKHFNMMKSGGALEAQYQYGVGADNILLNHSQRLRILQNGRR